MRKDERNEAAAILFIIALSFALFFAIFPMGRIVIEKENSIEYTDYYMWGNHRYGNRIESSWEIYLDPESVTNGFFAFSFILLIAGSIMGIWTIYYLFTKPKIASSFMWLSIFPLLLSLLLFNFGLMVDIDDVAIKAKLNNFDYSHGLLLSFYLFLLSVIFMMISYGLSTRGERKENTQQEFHEKTPPVEERPHIAPSIILIAIGIIMFVYGLAATLLIYSEINKPLFNFASSNIQWIAVFNFISGIAYAIVGIISMIKGFIDYSMQKEPMLNESQYTNLSIVFLILTWFVFPVIFGLFATLFGYIIYSKWNKNKGTAIIVAGIISTIISTILGIWSMQAMIK